MKSMSRKFGGLTSSKSADEADVSSILHDFKVADEMLDTLLNDMMAFRNAWDQILNMQLNISNTLLELYESMESEELGERQHIPADTPQKYLDKCRALQAAYANEHADLAQEISLLTNQLVKRAEDAKLHSTPLKRTIKHRENMKLDYERFLERVEKGRRKELRNQKEEMAHAKHESELAQARINYQTADDHVKENFPGVTDAMWSLLPYLRTSMIMLQTTLVGQVYTVLDEYTRQVGLPNPAPNNNEIVTVWDKEYTFFRKEVETSLRIITQGKTVHMPMAMVEKAPAATTLGIRSKVPAGRKPTAEPPGYSGQPRQPMIRNTASIHPPEEELPPEKPARTGLSANLAPATPSWKARPAYDEELPPEKPARPASSANLAPTIPNWKAKAASNGVASTYSNPPPPYEAKASTLTPDWVNRKSSEVQSNAGSSPAARYAAQTSPLLSSASNHGNDYFDGRRSSAASSIASQAVAAAVAKKKPPPPVPVKRVVSAATTYVTALFDFDAQNAGDLGFREGDRIRVTKKTGSTDDWWEGELNGRTGSFPANYVQL